MKQTSFFIFALLFLNLSFAQKKQNFTLNSPNGKIQVSIAVRDKITWAVSHEKDVVLAPSPMSLTLDENEILGKNAVVLNSKKETVDTSFDSPYYKKNRKSSLVSYGYSYFAKRLRI